MEPWSLQIGHDNGQTWSEPERVIEMRLAPADRLAAAYCSICPGSDGRTIHCFWVHKDDNAARVKGDKKHPWRPLKYKGLHEAVYRYNMYYVYRDPKGTWRNAAGEKTDLPISKAFADEHCLLYDSGDEFTSIGFPFVDSQNRPYVRFRTGVGDWKKGGTVIIPWRYKYAHYGSAGWQIRDGVPADWPGEVRTVAAAEGSAVYGDRSQGTWFMYYTNDRYNPDSPSSIFLYREKMGCATRKGGPAHLP